MKVKDKLIILVMFLASNILPLYAQTAGGGATSRGSGSFPDVIWIILAILVFLLLREVFCWYYKINKIVEILTNISTKLDNSTELKDINSISLSSKPDGNNK